MAKSRIQIGKTITVKGRKYKISAGTAKGKKYKATPKAKEKKKKKKSDPFKPAETAVGEKG